MATHMYRILFLILFLFAASSAFCQQEQYWSLTAKKALKGEKLSTKIVDESHKEFVNYGTSLVKKNNTSDLSGLSDEDSAMHYVNSIFLSVIDPKRHGGWPFSHVGINKSYSVIKKKLVSQNDVHLLVAVIIPALANRDAKFAITSYESLNAQDPLWAEYILEIVKKYCFEDATAKIFLSEVSNSN